MGAGLCVVSWHARRHEGMACATASHHAIFPCMGGREVLHIHPAARLYAVKLQPPYYIWAASLWHIYARACPGATAHTLMAAQGRGGYDGKLAAQAGKCMRDVQEVCMILLLEVVLADVDKRQRAQ